MLLRNRASITIAAMFGRSIVLLAAFSLSSAHAQAPDAVDDRSPPVAIDPELIDLDPITDKTELSYDERSAYYGILQHAGEVDQTKLRQAGADFVRQRWKNSTEFQHLSEDEFPVFVDILQHPDAYRGRPVFLRGHVIKTVKLSADEEFGFDELYECWLVTPDSRSHPLTVVFADNPDDLPIGETLVDGVSVAGYFFKLHRYSTLEKKDRFTPLILAHEVRIASPPQVAFPLPGWLISAVVLLLLGGIVLLVVRARQADKRFRRQYAEKMAESLPPKFDDLPGESEQGGEPA
ncbi:MAG: hypothetical protein DWQ45_15235 [Planctomycetota bacterium]|nr:MAG: hypothetical protein DWQ29_07155 [Planctomycetota bacterium]REK33537.1 MAG: hypothetical protein DWQ45_15235 [Planctomycetota bacterium]